MQLRVKLVKTDAADVDAEFVEGFRADVRQALKNRVAVLIGDHVMSPHEVVEASAAEEGYSLLFDGPDGHCVAIRSDLAFRLLDEEKGEVEINLPGVDNRKLILLSVESELSAEPSHIMLHILDGEVLFTTAESENLPVQDNGDYMSVRLPL